MAFIGLIESMMLFDSRDMTMVATSMVLFCTSLWMLLKKPSGVPPGPYWHTPVLGNLREFTRGKNMTENLRRFRAKYGDVYSLFLGRRLVVVISGLDAMKEAFVMRGKEFSHRPGLAHISCPKWKKVRQHIDRFFGPTEDSNDLSIKITEEEASQLNTVISEQLESTNILDPQDIVFQSTCRVICGLLFGENFLQRKDALKEITTTVRRISELSEESAISYFLPFLQYLPGGFCRMDELKALYLNLNNIINKQVEADSKISDSTKVDKQSGGAALTLAVTDMLCSGTTTVGLSIQQALWNLCDYPAIQDRIHTEIANLVGHNRQVSLQDREGLVFTQAFLMETLRTTKVRHTRLPRTIKQGVKFHNYVIPEETVVLPDLDSVLNDPGLWEHPEDFCPERFIKEGKISRPDAFIPFFIGEMGCIGEQLTMDEMFLFITTVVQRFKVLMEDNDVTITPHPRHFLVKIQERY